MGWMSQSRRSSTPDPERGPGGVTRTQIPSRGGQTHITGDAVPITRELYRGLPRELPEGGSRAAQKPPKDPVSS